MNGLLERLPACEHGSKSFISDVLVSDLSKLEKALSFELQFSSGYRCAVCNKLAGGVPNSGHLRGKAADIKVPDSNTRFLIIHAALRVGFRRIGVGKNFIHLDVDDALPQNMIWVYL